MKLAFKFCVLTLLLTLVVGGAASAEELGRRWAAVKPRVLLPEADTFFNDLAEELGIEVDELKTAFQNAVQKRMEQLRTEGEQETSKRPRIRIRPLIPNHVRRFFPHSGTQRLRPGFGIQARPYPGVRNWPGIIRR